jgi:3-oxoadipyl-CoA thiolase
MKEAVILSTVRTPFGKHGGSLASVRPDDLGALVIRTALERAGIQGETVSDVFFGCANQAGEDNRNIARMSTLLAGLPVSVPGVTVNRLCGSGLEAVNQAAKAIMVGEGKVFIAGGVESMSRAPWAMAKPEKGFAFGNTTMFDTTLGWRFVNSRMKDLYGIEAMGETAENLAEEYKISRLEQDQFALLSHSKAVKARASGVFQNEIVPVEIPGKSGTNTIDQDEGPREDSSLESLGKLRAAFRTGGSVTAGNSSTLNDGAGALVLASRDFANTHGLPVLATVRSFATAGVPPRIMGIGPVSASRKALEQIGIRVSDLAGIELNEAFAAQSLAVLRELELTADDPRINPNGGAIALGHPLGASGARIIGTLISQLRRGSGGLGLATMCIGVGQGIATVIEV